MMRSGLSLLFILLVSLPLVSAFGISPPSREHEYLPGETYESGFTIINDRNQPITVTLELERDLKKHITLETSNLEIPAKGRKSARYTLSIPERLPPGKNKAYIRALDTTEQGGGTFKVRVAVRGLIYVEVPYPGKYAILTFKTGNINVGQMTPFDIKITNKGNQTINKATLNIDVKDEEGKTKVTKALDGIEIKPGNTESISDTLPTSDLPEGPYTAIANFSYEMEDIVMQDSFRVGDFGVFIRNTSSTIYEEQISPFTTDLESNWNGVVEDVFVIVSVNGEEFKSHKQDMEAFEEKEFVSYVDGSDYEAGDKFNATISAHFGNITTTHEKTISVIKKPTKDQPMQISVSPTTLLLIAAMVLIALNIYILRKKK